MIHGSFDYGVSSRVELHAGECRPTVKVSLQNVIIPRGEIHRSTVHNCIDPFVFVLVLLFHWKFTAYHRYQSSFFFYVSSNRWIMWANRLVVTHLSCSPSSYAKTGFANQRSPAFLESCLQNNRLLRK